MLSAQMDYCASAMVREALANLGRTEDISFSPSNKRLALAGFSKNNCLVIDVQIGDLPTGKGIYLTDYIELHSPSLELPHGISFIDEESRNLDTNMY